MTNKQQRGYSLRKQPTAGSWLVIVSAGVGKHVTKVVHAPTEAKAHKAAQRILPELHKRADKLRAQSQTQRLELQPDTMTVATLTAHWLQARRIESRTSTTLAQYDASAAKWLPTLGTTPVANLTPEQIDQWLAGLTAASGRPLTNSTRLQVFNDLHNCLTWGHYRKQLPTPATRFASKPRHVTPKRTTPELSRFVDAVEALEVINSDVAGMALIAIGAGLREGEVCGLRWVDIGNRLTVAGAAKRDGSWGETKGRRERTVPISDIARMGIATAERLCPDGSPWLFPSPADPTVTRRPDWLSRQWGKLAPVVGLAGSTFHDLRHACASIMLREGVPLPDVSQILGHKDTRVTGEVYSHVMGELPDDAFGPMDRAMKR